jgi:capsular polysaccharide export protein
MSIEQAVPEAALRPDSDGWIGIMSQWIAWKVLHLPHFLDDEGPPQWLWRRGRRAPKGLKAIAGIGYKRSSDHARVLCHRWNIPYIALEDGFLRSSSLGVQGDTPMSMVVDPIGIHYLADRPSLLENILQSPEKISTQDLDTARTLISIMRSSGIGKYNHAPDLCPSDELGKSRPLVLVVDQTFGDFSIPGGGLCEADFIRMLDCALVENPDADVRVRIHPDCVAGYKKSCLLEAAQQRGVSVESRVISWSSLVRRARRVYVGTSQAGLEALIEGIPVTCFGLPFYAGWGLTDDRMPLPRRQARPSLLQLVAAAYIRYCRYVDPLTGERTDVLTVARQLALQKNRDSLFAGPLAVLGVKPEEQNMLRRFLHSRWGQLRFVKNATQALPGISAEGGKLVVYAGREPDGLQQHANAVQVPIWRITEGLLKPDGPIATRTSTLSLLLDRNGVDNGADHELTSTLVSHLPDSASLHDAACLRQRITELSGTRYPLYFDPYRNLPCDLEHALKLLQSDLEQRSAQRAPLPALVNYLRLMLGLNRAISPALR